MANPNPNPAPQKSLLAYALEKFIVPSTMKAYAMSKGTIVRTDVAIALLRLGATEQFVTATIYRDVCADKSMNIGVSMPRMGYGGREQVIVSDDKATLDAMRAFEEHVKIEAAKWHKSEVEAKRQTAWKDLPTTVGVQSGTSLASLGLL